MEPAAVMRLARVLQDALPADLRVIGSPRMTGHPPRLRVMRLVSASEAQDCRPELDQLIGEFRELARQLVARYRASACDAGGAPGGELVLDDATWSLHEHGEHCRFEHHASGVVMEANLSDRGAIDPYFLLQFAETSGRCAHVRSACLEGFQDMCRLLDLAGHRRRDDGGGPATSR